MDRDASPAGVADMEQRLVGPGGPFELREGEDGRKRFLRGPQNLVQVVRRVSALTAQQQLIADKPYTFAQVARAAAALLYHSPQMRDGARVVIVLPDGIEWLRAFVACAASRAVPILPRLGRGTSADGFDAVRDIEYDLLITDRRAGAASLGRRHSTIIEIDAIPHLVEGARLFAEGDCAGDARSLIAFTSGTTGRPKPIVHTHASLTAGLQNMLLASRLAAASASSQDVRSGSAPGDRAARPCVLLCAPFAYVAGFSQFLLAYLTGATIVAALGEPDLLGRIERHAVSSLIGPATDDLRRLAAEPELARRGATLQVIHGYGAEIPADVRHRLVDCIPHLRFGHGYGLTECVGPVAIADPAAGSSVLRLLPTFEAQVRARDHAQTGAAASGELWLRGSSLMLGYDRDGSLTGLEEGWFATGDEVEQISDSHFRLVGRFSRTIEDGDSRIVLAQVEERTMALIGGAEVAAFANGRARRAVRVAIVAEPDAAVLTRLQCALGAEFAGFRFEIFACADIPKLHGGKIDYLSLEERLMAAQTLA